MINPGGMGRIIAAKCRQHDHPGRWDDEFSLTRMGNGQNIRESKKGGVNLHQKGI
jgi:hypothetical protein